MKDSLVINKSYLAIQIVDWKKAISLVYQGSAQAVDENLQTYNFEDWVELSQLMTEHDHGFVHSPTMKIAVPEVIRLTKYDSLPKQDVKFTRRNIYEHYEYKCCYCGKEGTTKTLNLDHVLPRSRGGHTTWTNIVLSCLKCNTFKDNRTPEEAGMKLRIKPSRPKWQPVRTLTVQSPAPIPISWQRLLDSKYWESELKP